MYIVMKTKPLRQYIIRKLNKEKALHQQFIDKDNERKRLYQKVVDTYSELPWYVRLFIKSPKQKGVTRDNDFYAVQYNIGKQITVHNINMLEDMLERTEHVDEIVLSEKDCDMLEIVPQEVLILGEAEQAGVVTA